MGKVDDVWAQLKATTVPALSDAAKFERVWKTVRSGEVRKGDGNSGKGDGGSGKGTGKGESLGRGEMSAVTGQGAGDEAVVVDERGRDRPTQDSTASSSASCEETNVLTVALDRIALAETSKDLVAAVAKDLNTIASAPGVRDRKAALERIAKVVENAKTVALDRAAIDFTKPLLRRLEDDSQGCRELAATAIATIVRRVPDASIDLLPYIMPTLTERLWRQENNETSHNSASSSSAPDGGGKKCAPPLEGVEEVRLVLSSTIIWLIEGAGGAVAAYAGDALAIIESCAEDPYHQINLTGCKIAKVLLRTLGQRGRALSKQIVYALAPLMTHRRSGVRIEAIATVEEAVMSGGHEAILQISGWRDPNMVNVKAFYGDDIKINFFGKLATDENHKVRGAFLEMIGRWMQHLDERTDHEARLMPFVLSALSDDHVHVAERALAIVQQLGRQYEVENEDELKRMFRFTPELVGDSEEKYGEGIERLKLPRPFQRRPKYGERHIVFGAYKRLQYPICKELASWQEGPRLGAATLLRTCLVFVEDRIENELQKVLLAMLKNVSDASIREILVECATLIGRFANPEVWMPLLQSQIGYEAESGTRKNSLLLLSGAINGAFLERVAPIVGDLLDDIAIDVRECEDTATRGAYLELTLSISRVIANSVADSVMYDEEALITVLLVLMDVDEERVLASLRNLASRLGIGTNACDLVRAHRIPILQKLADVRYKSSSSATLRIVTKLIDITDLWDDDEDALTALQQLRTNASFGGGKDIDALIRESSKLK